MIKRGQCEEKAGLLELWKRPINQVRSLQEIQRVAASAIFCAFGEEMKGIAIGLEKGLHPFFHRRRNRPTESRISTIAEQRKAVDTGRLEFERVGCLQIEGRCVRATLWFGIPIVQVS